MKLSTIAIAAAITLSSAQAVAAQYRVIELPINEVGVNNFGQVITNDGTIVSVVRNEYNPKIDLSFLDFDNETFLSLLTDPDSAREGNFNAADLTLIMENFVNGPTSQRIASDRSYATDGTQVDLIPGFDQVTSTFEDYTGSVSSLVRDALDGNIFVGRADSVYYKFPYVDEDDNQIDYVISDVNINAFVDMNGAVSRLAPQNTTLGGLSQAYDINNNMQVVGAGTVELPEILLTAIDNCEDDDIRGDIPVEVCLFNLTVASSAVVDLFDSTLNAHVWQLDSNGALIDLKTYGYLIVPEDDDTLPYVSSAFGINDAGLAVGIASTGEIVISNNAQQLQSVAVSFSGDTINELLPREENLLSEALLANDDYIVGTVSRDFNSVTQKRLFLLDINTDAVIYPEGFFRSSTTVPRAINSNNEVVGEAESNVFNSQSREKSAFLYRASSDEFINLNTRIACDSPYTLIDAVDINDNGEILVNARVRVPQKDILGEIIIDDNGEQIIVDRAMAVKLEPINGGTIDDCGDEEKFERSGASINGMLILFLSLFAVRRRYRN